LHSNFFLFFGSGLARFLTRFSIALTAIIVFVALPSGVGLCEKDTSRISLFSSSFFDLRSPPPVLRNPIFHLFKRKRPSVVPVRGPQHYHVSVFPSMQGSSSWSTHFRDARRFLLTDPIPFRLSPQFPRRVRPQQADSCSRTGSTSVSLPPMQCGVIPVTG